MKILKLFICLFVSANLFAQGPELALGSPFQNIIQRANFSKALILPKGTTPTLNGAVNAKGALWYDSSQAKTSVWTGSAWLPFAADSFKTFIDTAYALNGSILNIALPHGLNAVPTSIYYKVNNVEGYSPIPPTADSNFVYIKFPVAPKCDTCIYRLLLKLGNGAVATGGDVSYNSGNGIPFSRTISTISPLTGGGDLSANRTLSIQQATTSLNGYLSATDFNIFNNKLSNITGLVSAGSNITITGTGTGASPYFINSTGGGSGSGTVNTGTQYQLGYYNANGTAISALSAITANRAIVSNSNGLPVASVATDLDLVQWHLAAVAQTLTDASTITMNCANGYVSTVTLGGNRNITFSNVPVNRQIEINIYQDATGNRSITFPANTFIPLGFGTGTSPNLSTAPNAWDKLYMSYDGTNYTIQFSKYFTH